MRRRPHAFTLLEVVVAVGVFAVGMVAVIGLLTPVARSVGDSADADAAARVADAVRAKLQTMPWATVAGMLKRTTGSGHELTIADNRSDYDLTKDAQLLFASRDGTKVGTYGDATLWLDPVTRRASDREKFFEVALIRNEDLSPGSEAFPDATAVVLGYTVRIRWPAFIADTATTTVQVGSNPTGSVRFDHSKKQALYFPGAVTR